MIAPLFACMSAPPTAWIPGRRSASKFRGRTAEERAEGEDPKPGIEHPAPAIDVPYPAELGRADRDDKEVNQDHPERGDEVACRELEMVGKARITMVESSDPMSMPA